MDIILASDDNKILARVKTWEAANVAAKALFKRQYWSDLYYNVVFDDGFQVVGSIDLEPESFHKPHQKEIFTWHLKTFWGNVSRLTPKSPYSGIDPDGIKFAKKLVTYLPNY